MILNEKKCPFLAITTTKPTRIISQLLFRASHLINNITLLHNI